MSEQLRRHIWGELDGLQNSITSPLTVDQISKTAAASMGRFFGRPPTLCTSDEKSATLDAAREWMNVRGRELTQQRRIV